MSQVTIQTSLADPGASTLSDFLDAQVEAQRALIRQYAPGVGQVLKGIRPVGDETIPVPCAMIDAKAIDPRMQATAKMNRWASFDYVYYVGDENPEAAAAKATAVQAIFMKLFSNDALNDNGASGKFLAYSPNWIESQMTRVEISPLFKFAADAGMGGQGPKYVKIGHFNLKTRIFGMV